MYCTVCSCLLYVQVTSKYRMTTVIINTDSTRISVELVQYRTVTDMIILKLAMFSSCRSLDYFLNFLPLCFLMFMSRHLRVERERRARLLSEQNMDIVRRLDRVRPTYNRREWRSHYSEHMKRRTFLSQSTKDHNLVSY